jgi:uncharacterized protein involved in exopolysaccharide biosynthesis
LNELRTDSEDQTLATQEPNGLLLEAVDEQALREARERMARRLRLLWNRRRFLFRVAASGLVLSTAVAFLIPKRYTSTARLMPPEQTSGTGAMFAALAGRAGGLAGSLPGQGSTGNLFVGILQSDTVRDHLIQKFGEEAANALAYHTRISKDQKSGIITIQVSDENPQRAAALTEGYINELNWVVNHLTTSSARRERVFLDQRLQQVKSGLEAAEQRFSQFASQKGAIDIPTQDKAMVEAVATLQSQLIAAESELQSSRQIYTDNNIRVRSLQARRNELRRALEKIGGKGANETSTSQQIYPSLRELPLLGVTYADLLRWTKVEESTFETLTQEDELAKVEEAREIPSVKVLDPPEVPQKKSFPPRLPIMILGTTLAFMGGLVWVLGQAAWEATETADPRKALATEVWSDMRGSLPWASPNGSRMARPMAFLRKRIRRQETGEFGETTEKEEAEQQREQE